MSSCQPAAVSKGTLPERIAGAMNGQDTLVLGTFLRDVAKLNQEQHNFRIFGPDETVSNLLGAVFEVTNRQWDAREVKNDEFLAPAGRVLDSMLSENQCEGWLEGYLLTGRHGLFNSYEAFIRIVDSMFSQHAKWLKVCLELPWRRKISPLNYQLASHVWQQDHRRLSEQECSVCKFNAWSGQSTNSCGPALNDGPQRARDSLSYCFFAVFLFLVEWFADLLVFSVSSKASESVALNGYSRTDC
jgi:phosphoketolase